MIQSIVDLQRHPIQDIQTEEGRTVIELYQQEFRENGLCMLSGFLLPEALSIMVSEAQRLSSEAYVPELKQDNQQSDESFTPSTNPRATKANFGAIAYDQLRSDSLLRTLYEWDGLTNLIAGIVGKSKLHRTADPLVSCTLSFFHKENELEWHYDTNDVTVSLLLQAADEGGAFEFVAPSCDSEVDTKALEKAVLDGHTENVICHQLVAGTLSIFNGNRALHRVAPVTNEPERIIALLNYATEADYVFSEQVHMKFFGRKIQT